VRQDQRFAFIGDLAWQLAGITHGVQRPLLMRRSPIARQQRAATVTDLRNTGR
jgi:hypothetical protein